MGIPYDAAMNRLLRILLCTMNLHDVLCNAPVHNMMPANEDCLERTKRVKQGRMSQFLTTCCVAD